MMNPSMKYLLSLCILLLSSFSQLSAHINAEHTSYSPTENTEGLIPASLNAIEHSRTFMLSSYPGSELELRIEVTDVEEKEDEWISPLKYLESSDFSTAAFHALAFEYLSRHFNKGSPFYGHFSHVTSHGWYILFQVIRI